MDAGRLGEGNVGGQLFRSAARGGARPAVLRASDAPSSAEGGDGSGGSRPAIDFVAIAK